MEYIDTIKKYISGKQYATSNVRSADGTIAYITSTGVSKIYPSEDVYNSTAGKNNCKADFIQLTPNWTDLGFPVGTLMKSGQSCGNENTYVQSIPPENNFDWQGKRKDQVESSYKIIWYSTIIFVASVIVGLITSLF